jgi:DNA recombination protein RmuC
MDIALYLLAGAVAGAVIAAFWSSKTKHQHHQTLEKAATEQRQKLESDLADRERAIEGYLEEIESQKQKCAEIAQDLAVTKQREQGAKEQFEEAQKQARDTFQSLANQVLEKSNASFLQLATKTLEGDKKEAAAQLDQRKQAIESLVKPIKESLDKHQKAVGEIEKEREGAYRSLRENLSNMMQDQQQLRSETSNLVSALRKPEVRGKWGELQLRRVAELAGMIPHCDFTEQLTTSNSEDRSLRPDMVVHLPAGREIVVDSKATMQAYLDALEASDDETRDQHLDRHVQHIETQITNLAGKNYQNQFERSPDFVILFIPGEAFLEAALRRKPQLYEAAFKKDIILAAPSTLIALLKAVHLGWREERVAENAETIRQLGEDLHERIAVATGHIDKMGKSLEQTVKNYNQFVGSYESRVVSSARRFKELGADSSKELPAEGEINQVEIPVREIKQIANSQ